jgi:hypothetical protein
LPIRLAAALILAMKASALIAAASLTLASLLPQPSLADEPASAYEIIKDVRCINAMHQVHSDVENRLGGDIQGVELNVPMLDSPAAASPVLERQKRIVFNLNTQWSRGPQATQRAHNANQAITNSPQLVRNYAEKVIASCPEVGSVVFFMWEWGAGWSLGADSRLIQDRCVYPSEGRSIYIWGEVGCS